MDQKRKPWLLPRFQHANDECKPMILEPALGDSSVFVSEPHDDVRQRQNDITVKRPVLTQQAFDQLHEPSAKSKKSLVSYVQSLAGNVTCTKKQLKKQALKLVPCIDMVRNYDVKSWLAVDLVCGLTIGIICIPQSMGYALLAGVPPVYGLYSSFLPVFLYCLFATSRHMCFGTLAITSLLVGNVVARVSSQIVGSAQSGSTTSTSTSTPIVSSLPTTAVAWSSEAADSGSPVPNSINLLEDTSVKVAVCLAFYMGIIQLFIGVVRLGFITIYFADSMVAGYTTGTVLHVLTSQLSSLFGISFPRQSGIFNLIKTWILVFQNIANTNIVTLSLSLVCIAVLGVFKFLINPVVMKKLRAPVPIELLVIIGGIVASDLLSLNANYDVDVVGPVEPGLPPPAVPDLSLTSYVIVDAVVISFVNFAVSVSLAQVLAKKHDYEIDENQEAIAYGICNFFPSFFQTIPTGNPY